MVRIAKRQSSNCNHKIRPRLSFSFHRFTSMFQPLYKKNPQKMENIHKQFLEELKKAIQVHSSGRWSCLRKSQCLALLVNINCDRY